MNEEDKKALIHACTELLMETVGNIPPRSADNIVRITADILCVVNRSDNKPKN